MEQNCMYRWVTGSFGRQAHLGKNTLKIGFCPFLTLKLILLQFWVASARFIFKNTTFHFLTFFLGWSWNFNFFWGLRISAYCHLLRVKLPSKSAPIGARVEINNRAPWSIYGALLLISKVLKCAEKNGRRFSRNRA